MIFFLKKEKIVHAKYSLRLVCVCVCVTGNKDINEDVFFHIKPC